jgi:hypothetical protein
MLYNFLSGRTYILSTCMTCFKKKEQGQIKIFWRWRWRNFAFRNSRITSVESPEFMLQMTDVPWDCKVWLMTWCNNQIFLLEIITNELDQLELKSNGSPESFIENFGCRQKLWGYQKISCILELVAQRKSLGGSSFLISQKTIGLISVDPSKRKTGGAFGWFRMNAINNPRVYMRSANVNPICINMCWCDSSDKSGSIRYHHLGTSGIGQSDTELWTIRMFLYT